MQVEVILGIGGLLLYSAAIWALGWHYGGRSFRDRNRKFLKTMKEFNKTRDPKSQWWKGYQEGIASTLDAFDRFLDQFRVSDDEPT